MLFLLSSSNLWLLSINISTDTVFSQEGWESVQELNILYNSSGVESRGVDGMGRAVFGIVLACCSICSRCKSHFSEIYATWLSAFIKDEMLDIAFQWNVIFLILSLFMAHVFLIWIEEFNFPVLYFSRGCAENLYKRGYYLCHIWFGKQEVTNFCIDYFKFEIGDFPNICLLHFKLKSVNNNREFVSSSFSISEYIL
jgi:hypothetical protein